MFETGTATDYADLIDKLNTFLTAKGSAFGLSYSGTGTGTLTDYSGGASSVAETFTITATSPTVFDVVGSVSGDIGDATVGTPFSHAKLEFTITAGGTAFIVGDEFVLSTAPKWTAHRKCLGCRVLADLGNTGTYGAQNMVDGKNEISSYKFRAEDPETPFDIEIEFFEAETIHQYQLAMFLSSQYSYGPKAWTFDYWTGSAWSTLDSESGHDDWTQTAIKTFDVGSPVSATKYRLHVTELNTSSYLHIGAFRLLRSDGVDAAFSQTIWEAPGNDGDSEILVGVHGFERQDADYFDWEIAAFDGYLASALWREQTGFHGQLFVPLWDASIPYWFVADGRRVIVVAKISTQYEVAYLGFIDAYYTPEQMPYPIALGGSLTFDLPIPGWHDDDYRWSTATLEHSAFPISDYADSGTGVDPTDYQMRLRSIDGTWIGFAARVAGGEVSMSSRDAMWPYCGGLDELDVNLDGGYSLFPIMLNTLTPNTFGQLAGVACVTGQGLTAETLITKGSVDWLALHNIFRTERDDWFAIALD